MKIMLLAGSGLLLTASWQFLLEPVKIPLAAVIGLAVLPTAEFSAAMAAAFDNVTDRVGPQDNTE